MADLISVAAIVVGFGTTVIMFRIQRELHVREEYKWSTWIAFADTLIFCSVALAVSVVVMVLAVPNASFPTAAAMCVASVILQAGYIPSILAHYRIAFGARRDGFREQAEPCS